MQRDAPDETGRGHSEQEVALAQQEVQFYRRMEHKGMLPLISRQVRDSKERLRKANPKELENRSLPQQAKSLRDKLQSIEARLSQQRIEASKIAYELAALEARHPVRADSRIALKLERAGVRARLDLVEESASRTLS